MTRHPVFLLLSFLRVKRLLPINSTIYMRLHLRPPCMLLLYRGCCCVAIVTICLHGDPNPMASFFCTHGRLTCSEGVSSSEMNKMRKSHTYLAFGGGLRGQRLASSLLGCRLAISRSTCLVYLHVQEQNQSQLICIGHARFE
jgi:hypothetical protein